MSQQPSSDGEYEFDDSQNSTISSVAGAMKFVAIVELILGTVYLVLAVLQALGNAIGSAIGYATTGVITIVLAMMTNTMAAHFRNVVDTKGQDMLHLMGALTELGKYFSLKRTLYIIGLVLLGIAIVFVVLFSVRSGHSH